MKIKDLLDKKCIDTKVKISGKREIIEYLLDLAIKSGRVINRDVVLRDLLEREKVLSTGIGRGIAMPHCKTTGISNFVISAMTTSEPVDFDALDGEPVSFFIMVLGMESQVGLNLKILSKISKILNSEENRINLIQSKSPEEIYDILISFDEQNQ